MSATRLSQSRVALFGCLAVAAIGFAVAAGQPNNAAQPPTSAAPAPPIPDTPVAAPAKSADRLADRTAIEKAIESFSSAFQKGDAKVLVAHWTSEGEYISDDGTTFNGRAALEKAYAEFFTKNPDNALTVEVDSIRFPSRDTAVLEGHFKLLRGKKKELTVSRCSFLYTREDGKWLIAIAREWPGDGLAIRDLEWLIGSWEAKRNGTVVTTKYEWAGNKSFIRCHFTITQDGKTKSGMQMIGKDPSTGGLRTGPSRTRAVLAKPTSRATAKSGCTPPEEQPRTVKS